LDFTDDWGLLGSDLVATCRALTGYHGRHCLPPRTRWYMARPDGLAVRSHAPWFELSHRRVVVGAPPSSIAKPLTPSSPFAPVSPIALPRRLPLVVALLELSAASSSRVCHHDAVALPERRCPVRCRPPHPSLSSEQDCQSTRCCRCHQVLLSRPPSTTIYPASSAAPPFLALVRSLRRSPSPSVQSELPPPWPRPSPHLSHRTVFAGVRMPYAAHHISAGNAMASLCRWDAMQCWLAWLWPRPISA
jgi:hypothetical protein